MFSIFNPSHATPTSNFQPIRLLDPVTMTNSADPDQLPIDLDLHCLLRQGMSCLARDGLIFSSKTCFRFSVVSPNLKYLHHMMHNTGKRFLPYVKTECLHQHAHLYSLIRAFCLCDDNLYHIGWLCNWTIKALIRLQELKAPYSLKIDILFSKKDLINWYMVLIQS